MLNTKDLKSDATSLQTRQPGFSISTFRELDSLSACINTARIIWRQYPAGFKIALSPNFVQLASSDVGVWDGKYEPLVMYIGIPMLFSSLEILGWVM